MLITKCCKNCGVEFQTKYPTKLHCTRECGIRWRDAQKPKVPEEKKACWNCGGYFIGKPGRKYCKKACREEFQALEAKTGRKIGVPTMYKERYCIDVIEHMKTGQSLASFAASVGTHRDVVARWRRKYKSFDMACQTGMELALQWWEKFSATVAVGKHMDKAPNANVGMIQFIMKQRFYRDYNRAQIQEIKIEGGDKGMEFKLNYDPKGLSDES